MLFNKYQQLNKKIASYDLAIGVLVRLAFGIRKENVKSSFAKTIGN